MEINANLTTIAALAIEREAENESFKSFLQSQDGDVVDALVQELDALITPQIDCTACGNCCRQLMINVDAENLGRLATHLDRTEEDVIAEYIETSANRSMMVMNTIPCHFLKNNCCTVYEYRFEDCRVFPGLHLPQFNKRLFSMLSHYGRCPIIFNVLEEMKVRMAFRED